MVRGGPVKRTKGVFCRLTPEEWAAWDARREASGRKEMGAWIREVVHASTDVQLPPQRRGSVHVAIPEANLDAYRQLVRVGNNLNQIARKLNATGQHTPQELTETLQAVRVAARMLMGRG